MINSLHKYTILYAEDDNEMRNNYSNYFQALFKEVHIAKDGLEALHMYENHFPDILLLDISMPYIDGLTLAKKIREHDEVVKIIILTAHGDQEKLLNAVKLNLVDYLLKPIKRSSLLLALEEAVASYVNSKDINRPIKLNNDYTWYAKNKELYKNNTMVHLTIKEQHLLSLLFSNYNHFFSIDAIIEHYFLHMNETQMSLESIRGVIKRLKMKLPKESIVNSFGVGYKIEVK